MMRVENQTFDKEREFYGSSDVTVVNCKFEGPADGESAFKESRNVTVDGCLWNLRYPFWHDTGVTMKNTELTELCRAAFWYSGNIEITESKLHGVKAMRECTDVTIRKSDIVSPEFGWSVHNIRVEDSAAAGEYFMMRSSDIAFKDVEFTGKYSFQYVENAVIKNCVLHTKDAFWHAKNVVIRNCVVEGEYLAWYAEDITFENCKISGTQPFCYCKNLKLVNCEMLDADLSFEKSEVEAELTAPILSIKNPKSGYIKVPSVGELILDDPEAKCEVFIG
ncbi:MAG: DUF3737 family protein [Lachnospiraceae bacterium]|nr:DUF3737 family protein [Lachnospiraceae bacterium]MBQ8846633.1 DUF3737 family protein [Lachnospiraceae bacterium]